MDPNALLTLRRRKYQQVGDRGELHRWICGRIGANAQLIWIGAIFSIPLSIPWFDSYA